MTTRYFITGTDTDCGKTYVTCKLLQWINTQKKAHAIKPVASGASKHDEQWIQDDLVALRKHTHYPNLPMNGWVFEDPVSPHIAAKKVGQRVTAKDIATFCEHHAFNPLDTLLIEGAGGLMVPLNEKETWIDFLNHSHIPVILVVGLTLGCLNHALMTHAVLQMNQISCVGWIANFIDESMLEMEENMITLIQHLTVPLLGTVPFNGTFKPIEDLEL